FRSTNILITYITSYSYFVFFSLLFFFFFFFFNDPATTEIYTLSLHDALPIYIPSNSSLGPTNWSNSHLARTLTSQTLAAVAVARSEEHTSELQSRSDLVCRLLLEKKKIKH